MIFVQYFDTSVLKGALWGAIAGDFFSFHPHSQLFLNDDFNGFSGALEIAFLGFKRVNYDGFFHINCWLKDLENNGYAFNNLSFVERAIALMPLILHCHDHEAKLVDSLSELNNMDSYQSILDLNLIIKSILNKKDNLTLNNELLENNKNLYKIQEYISNKETNREIEKKFKQDYKSEEISIYQGIYYFLSMPNYVELSLLRSTHSTNQNISILTGFLLGLHNSYYAIPLSWRKYFQLIPTVREKNIDLLSQQFIDTWQGKYLSFATVQKK